MKPISVDVSEPIYRDFQRLAETTRLTTSELIREAMKEYRDRRLRRRGNLSALRPHSVGRIRPRSDKSGNLFNEMLGGEP